MPYLLLLSLGCSGGSSGDDGSISVNYGFIGVESPSRVSLYLLDKGSAVSCETLSTNPFDLASQSLRSLPPNGAGEFTSLEAESEWIVAAVGANDGVVVATGCADDIKIEGGETSFIELNLHNEPLDIQGAYTSHLEFNVGLPVEAIGAVLTYDALYDDVVEFVCDLLVDCTVPDSETQRVATDVLSLMSSLDIEVEWQFRQSADLIHGEIVWNTVEGVVVDPSKWTLIEGSVSGEIPGATQVVFTSHDLRIHTEELTLFILEEVMGEPTTGVSDTIDPVLPDMSLNSGGAVAIDDDFTGQADRVSGEMIAELDFLTLGFVHSFEVVWVANRISGN